MKSSPLFMALQSGGALLLDKPVGPTSFGCLDTLSRFLRESLGVKKKDLPSIGHCGTLDPFASGLLVVCFGRATKLSRFFLECSKTYETTIEFGKTSVSGDHTNPISEETTNLPASIEDLKRATLLFLKTPYLQTPPMHSAKKVDGKALYELARKGIEIERKATEQNILEFKIHFYAPPFAKATVQCSSGTYVRTLGQDFAKHLGSLAWLTSLRRTHLGALSLERAIGPGEFSAFCASFEKNHYTHPSWIPFDQLLRSAPGFAHLSIDSSESEALLHGKQNMASQIASRLSESPHCKTIAAYQEENLRAILTFSEERRAWEIERCFSPTRPESS